MRFIMNLLRGTVVLVASGPFPERLLNLCAQQGVAFWGLEWLDGTTIRLVTRGETLKRLQALAQKVDCQVEVERRAGLPFFLNRFRTRYAFVIGLTLSLTAVFLMSNVVLTIQVTGNETVSSTRILSELRRLGVRPGVYGPSLDRHRITQEALLTLEDLSFLSINLHGTRLEVIVRERIKSPELAQEEGYYHIVSKADGIITQVEAMMGDAVVAEGDTVAKGEVLISGLVTLEPPLYSDRPNRYYQVHARGRVYARTWRTLTAAIPLQAGGKDYTGEEKSLWSLTFFDRRLNFYRNGSISWPSYDKITVVHRARLPGAGPLPLTLTEERCRKYQITNLDIDLEAAQTLLEDQLLKQLQGLLGPDGTVESTQYSAQVRDGRLEVALTAECSEEIGREVPAQQEEPMVREEGQS